MAFPGEERLRRWGPHWGKAGGDRGLPLEGLGARDGGLQWWLHGEGADSGGLDRGGGGPAALDGGKRVGEHRWRPRKLATGSFGREEGRRRELRGRSASGGANGGGGRVWTPWGLGLALGTGRGVEGEVESSLAKQMEGRREGRG